MLSFPTDRATQYAAGVLSGDIVAGPHVRDACTRHFRDLVTGAERGLTWNVEEVDRVIGFFEVVLTVEVELVDDEGELVSEAVPFHVEPSQAFILGSLFGWRNRKGNRRFRRAFIEIGKGNGKSPLAAGIGHYMLSATKKLRAEVYSAATDKDQDAILFRDAVEMWRRSDALRRRLISSGVNPVWQLTYPDTGSFFKPISSEKKGKSGIRPYCALIDEIHEHPDNGVIEMLRAGTKGNQQALILEITNSGFDRTSVCWSEHEMSVKVASGEIENDAWFSYVCALDEDDDPFSDESCWIKANPLLGVSIHPEFVREQVNEAKGMPNKEGIVRRLHFCEWTDAGQAWIGRKAWESCEAEIRFEDYMGESCYLGLDLSFTQDLSALAAVFPVADEYHAFLYFWKPKEGLQEAIKRDRVPYDLWVKSGFIELTEGKVIKLPRIASRIGSIQDDTNLEVMAYDRYRHKELDDDLLDLGFDIPSVEHPQGFRRAGDNPLWMPSSFQALENAIIEGKLKVAANPVLRWNVASTVVRDDPSGTDNHIFDKRKSTARIDGTVALAMGVGAASIRESAVDISDFLDGMLKV